MKTKPKRKTTTSVEEAYLKFIHAALALQDFPDYDENTDKAAHRAWEKMLRAADRATNVVISKRAICLKDLEYKIQAWAFSSTDVKRGPGVKGLATWKPQQYSGGGVHDAVACLASLRDDIETLKKFAWGASVVVGSLVSPPPLPQMPTAEQYPRR